MSKKVCQSCGMPMGDTNELYGSEKNNEKSLEYCHFCYENGEFKYDVTIEGMIDILIPFMLEHNKSMKEEEARNIMVEFLPTLKRWK